MKERAYMNGGTYNVYSSPGKGTIIEGIFPINTQKIIDATFTRL
jgi:hypothetical protein